jgi:hypothetical protein
VNVYSVYSMLAHLLLDELCQPLVAPQPLHCLPKLQDCSFYTVCWLRSG